MTPADITRLQAAVDAAEEQLKRSQVALAEAKSKYPQALVGKCFRDPLARLSRYKLVESARNDACWLAKQCIREGPGAASDSGLARIVVTLEELSTRLQEEAA